MDRVSLTKAGALKIIDSYLNLADSKTVTREICADFMVLAVRLAQDGSLLELAGTHTDTARLASDMHRGDTITDLLDYFEGRPR